MIQSPTNPKLKELKKLLKRKESSFWQDAFCIEGEREVLRALENGFDIYDLFFCHTLSSATENRLSLLAKAPRCYQVDETLFQNLVMRESTVRLLAVAKKRYFTPEDVKLKQGPFLALEGIEKPGNIGALLRSADAVGIEGVIILEGTSDPFHHNVVRSSTGALFSLPLIKTTVQNWQAFCEEHEIRLYAASPEAQENCYNIDFVRSRHCFVLGGEAQGLSSKWDQSSINHLAIPMHGICDSLNVSVSGAILLYESLRQRRYC